MNLETQLAKVWKHLVSIQGWRTNRKIIVIESDDWGSIRMPSREIYEKCLKNGYPVDKTVYERYDSLLSQADLEMLFDLLQQFVDIEGNHPIFTANCVVANPDFYKIGEDKNKKYHFELLPETFKRYPQHSENFNLWKQAMSSNIFHPQYHAREHLNVSLFMDALQKNEKDILFGLENEMPGCIPQGPQIRGNPYVEATRYSSLEDKEKKLKIFLEGLDIFEKLFGYRSESTIPPNYIWSPDFNEAVMNKGVMFFQGIRKFREPYIKGGFRYHPIYTGKKNQLGQTYIVRNCFFEPSMVKLGISDPVGKCMSDISIAFRMRKPAVIGSHRLNYVGYIDESNRDRSLKMLDLLIRTALKKWPDIEFMTTDNLGRIILNEKTNLY